ncbi:MAG: hypothetical protein WBG39_05330 [Gordonia sp. (in: high G+C Gram-positive bacteria)]
MLSARLLRARADMASGEVSFGEAIYGIRSVDGAGSAILDGLAAEGGEHPLVSLWQCASSDPVEGWDPTVAVAVIVQSLLVGTPASMSEHWRGEFVAVLEMLPEDDWVRAVDGVVRSFAGSLLTSETMRRMLDRWPDPVDRATRDYCCQTLASAALNAGDTDAAIWAVGRAASPFHLAGTFVETCGANTRESVKALYREVSGMHCTDRERLVLAAAHWLMLDDVELARAAFDDAEQFPARRPDGGSDSGWVLALVAELIGEGARAQAIAEEYCDLRTLGLGLPPVVGWILSRRIDDAIRRREVLAACLVPGRLLGGLRSRLLFDLAKAQYDCGEIESARQSLLAAASARTGVFDAYEVEPAYGQMETLLARLKVTGEELQTPWARQLRDLRSMPDERE